MTNGALLLSAALTLFAAACGSSPASQNPDSGGAKSEAGPDACDHDGCMVPLADVMGVCGPNLHARTNDCPGVKVETGTCGTITHAKISTVGPVQDCYYTTATGELVGAVTRSDSGFTKNAGTIPAEACPATTQVCDHMPPV